MKLTGLTGFGGRRRAAESAGGTIGMETVGSSQVSIGEARCWFLKFTMPSGGGDATKLTAYISVNTGSTQIKGLLYDHDSTPDRPGNLIVAGDAITPTDDGTFRWVDLTFASSEALTGSTDYWMGMISSSGSPQVNTKYGGVSDWRVIWNADGDTFASPQDSPNGGTVLAANGVSIYLTYT